jgi:hypothetical protein
MPAAALLALAILLAQGSMAQAFPSPTIRVGGPSAPDDPKVAIVAGGRSLSHAPFQVIEGARVILRGNLRSAPGSSAPWPDAFRANLSSIRRPGAYRVRVAGHVSRRWRVSAGGSSALIPLILQFFETNRDGAEPALLHGPSHLNDATLTGAGGRHFDLTGGWMDAGDMLHFTQTTAYATMVLEAAARLDPRWRAQLDVEAQVGVDWLLKAHPAAGVFVTQVGDDRDHNRAFSNPALDDASGLPGIAHRRAYHWGQGVGGDIGGKVAAALAIAAEGAAEPRRSALITAAREWYAAGRRAGRATPPLDDAGGFYVIHSWRDSLAAGAAALYRATGEGAYLSQARHYLAQTTPRVVLGYFNVAPLAAADICGRLGAPSLGNSDTKREGCRFLHRNGRRSAAFARRGAFGLAGPAAWGTTSTNGGGGAIAALSGRRGVAAGARDYLLGRNPWGASFLSGFGPHSPRRISSWASVFGRGLPHGAIVGGPAPRHILRGHGFGGGGPLRRFDSSIAYEDNSHDYVTSEPALDYAANSILLLAALHR